MRFLVMAATLTALASLSPAGAGEAPPPEEHRFSEPHTHKNLTIFLIHGKDRIAGKKFITLQEALERKKAVLHETGNVQKLAIENLSADEILYLQSGDIVKGGKQDRVIAYDFIVKPKSGKVPISSFCVESGRWRSRGNESAIAFQSSMQQVVSQDLKLAAKLEANQGKVWEKVAESQTKLARSVNAEVRSDKSRTSMQLTLENKKVQESIKEYREKFGGLPAGEKDVIGFAFAINGKVNSVDIYASGELFRKLWPKLLESAATEAVGEFKKDLKVEAVSAEQVKTCIAEARKGAASEKKLSDGVRMTTRKAKVGDKEVYIFSTRHEPSGVNVHENMLAK